MKKVAISIGGSILSSMSVFDVEFAKGLAQVLSRHSDTRFVIATGGGRLAREAVSAMSAVYDNKYDLDKIAIMPTRLHAMMLMSVISSVKGTEGDVHQAVPVSPDEARSALELKRIVVHGGFIPGMTTDSCAALSAEAMGAKLLVNVSKTNHIYDKDPKGNKDAKPLHRMTYDQLIRLAGESDGRDPGSNFVFDLVAAKLIKRSRIKTVFVGKDPEALESVLSGRRFEGTTVE